jgi:hypothetical protein
MSFYITLPSNVVSKSFPNNTIANYATVLSQRINFEGTWTVGVSEISYTKSWYNVINSHKIMLFDENSSEIIGDIYVSSGYYESEEKLINEINYELQKIKNIVPPKIKYNKLNNKIYINAGLHEKSIKVYPYFGEEIENILGLKNINNIHNSDVASYIFKKKMYKNMNFEAFYPVEISAGYHTLYVYSNIVYPSYIGDTCAQLLRVVEVPKDASFGEQCVIRYENPQYRPLLLNEINNIEISIKDDNGELIPFKFGRAIVTLHFKKL